MSTMKQVIAEFFYRNSTKVLTKGQLRKEIEVEESQDLSFQQALKELEKEGLLHVPKKGKIHGYKSHAWVIGRLNVNPKGYGFVVNREESKAVFIPKEQMNDALHKDVVIVKITRQTPEMNNPEGEIISILKREIKTLVGTYQSSEEFGFVVTDDPRFQKDIYIPEGLSLEAQSNDKVVVVITEYPKRNRNPVGKIIEVLGLKGDKDAELLSILKEKNIAYEFPTEVIDQASKMETTISNLERKNRLDLTSKTIFTIDGEDAKDLDDAISIEKMENGHYLLGVHIADVAHYVNENSPIDEEALQRGTSVYLIDTVIPMLPKELSNQLCSLQPHEDKLTLSVMMEINHHGVVVNASFHESVIHSKARLTYKEVTNHMEGQDTSFAEQYPFLLDEMNWLHELTLILQKKRHQRGSIDFEFDEAKILLDEHGKVEEVKAYERGISNQMIEESMLVCNETVAEFFAHKELPFVYRVHSQPREEKMGIFASFIEFFGHTLSSLEEIVPKELQSLLEETKESKEGKTIQLLLLRSMMQARYSPECKGHFGLATSYYTHFTSPIRRYPDLQIHRILKEYLARSLHKKRKEQLQEIVQESSKIASRRERNAEQAEEEYKHLKKVEWMKGKIGEQFEGMVTEVARTSLTVTLPNTVDGKVLLHLTKEDVFVHDEDIFAWIGQKAGYTIQLGDTIKVKVRDASIEQREVIFDIVFN